MGILKKNISLLILFATLIRCLIAVSINLGNDEVYYITYARHLQWNYFDHPPFVALLIKLTSLNLLLTSDFFIRLGPILLAAINTYFIYAIAKKIKDEKSGMIAAVLYSASIYSSIIAGVFILPDAPQLFFWMGSIYCLINIVGPENQSLPKKYYLLLFGLCTGLCIMSKVHGVFLLFGYGLYILIYDRKKLSNGYFYLAILITAAIISPILFWNIDNDFITYNFHSNRVTINSGINFNSFIREFFGGVLYNNPINYFLIISSLIACWKNKIIIAAPYIRILLLLSLPLIGILLFISLFRDTLPHWSGPGYTALMILSACYLSDAKSKLQKLVYYSLYLIIGISFLGIILIQYYPGTLGNKTEISLGKKDFTLDMYDWNFFKTEFKKIRDKDIQSGITKTTFILNNKWFPGAHIDNYMAQPLGLDFIALGKLEDIHTYAWLNTYRKQLKIGDDAYFITVSNSFSDPKELYQKSFKKINAPVVIKQFRSKKPTRNMLVYLLQDYTGE